MQPPGEGFSHERFPGTHLASLSRSHLLLLLVYSLSLSENFKVSSKLTNTLTNLSMVLSMLLP